MDLDIYSLHRTILLQIIDKGYGPNVEYLSKCYNTSREQVVQTLKSLEDYHGVVLHPHNHEPWVIHPFSLAPNNFVLNDGQTKWWSNCGWCSLGAAHLLNRDLTISTTLGSEGVPIEISIENGELISSDLFVHFPIPMSKAWDNVIYTCSTMLIFKDHSEVEDWSERHRIPLGDIQPIRTIWSFAKDWYGNHLNENWHKWTIEEAKALFHKHGLTHNVWQLNESNERF